MTSNALSRRRTHIARPIVCKKPPDPPPEEEDAPPVVWPPPAAHLLFHYTWEDIDGIWEGGWEFDMPRQPAQWVWIGIQAPYPNRVAEINVDVPSQTASFGVIQWTGPGGEGIAVAYDVPIVWDEPTIYIFENGQWDDLTFRTAKAVFTF